MSQLNPIETVEPHRLNRSRLRTPPDQNSDSPFSSPPNEINEELIMECAISTADLPLPLGAGHEEGPNGGLKGFYVENCYWKQPTLTAVEEAHMEDFFTACDEPVPRGYGLPLDTALQLLAECNYNVEEAWTKVVTQRLPVFCTVTWWNPTDVWKFENAFGQYGKDFSVIADELHRPVSKVIEFYYKWKNRPRQQGWVNWMRNSANQIGRKSSRSSKLQAQPVLRSCDKAKDSDSEESKRSSDESQSLTTEIRQKQSWEVKEDMNNLAVQPGLVRQSEQATYLASRGEFDASMLKESAMLGTGLDATSCCNDDPAGLPIAALLDTAANGSTTSKLSETNADLASEDSPLSQPTKKPRI